MGCLNEVLCEEKELTFMPQPEIRNWLYLFRIRRPALARHWQFLAQNFLLSDWNWQQLTELIITHMFRKTDLLPAFNTFLYTVQFFYFALLFQHSLWLGMLVVRCILISHLNAALKAKCASLGLDKRRSTCWPVRFQSRTDSCKHPSRSTFSSGSAVKVCN